MNVVNKLSTKDLVKGLSELKYEKDYICGACINDKQINILFKPKNGVSTPRPLNLLH